MILGIGDVYVQVPHRRTAEEVMAAAAQRTLVEEGCQSFMFAEVLREPGHFVVLESWSDREAVERHYGSPAFADYQRAITKLLVRESEFRLHVVAETLRPVDSSMIVTGQDD